MKNSCIFYLVFGGVFTCLAFGYDWTTNPGDGSANNPYQISTAEQLTSIGSDATLLSRHFILTASIDLVDYSFSTAVIAPDTTITNFGFDGNKFTGSLNGQGYKILNLTIDRAGGDYMGLFGYLNTGAVVKDLTLDTASISGGETSYYLGGIAGYSKGTIRNCHFVGGFYCGDNSILIGGIAGQSDGPISQCSANVNLHTEGGCIGVGGIAGQNSGQMQLCFSTGTIASCLQSYRIGGLVGDNVNGSIVNCYSSVKITSYYSYIYQIGGLVGRSSGAMIANSCSTGLVFPGSTTAPNVGGLQGLNYGTVANCFWDTTASGQSSSAGGTGKTTAQMQKFATFTGATWDFVGESANGSNEIWRMCVDDVSYPRLSWEYAANGDFACLDNVAIDDLLALAAQWLTTYAAAPTTFSFACDANGDEIIDHGDFNTLSKNWLTPGIISSKVEACTMDLESAGFGTEVKSAAATATRFTVTVDGQYIHFSDLIFANCCLGSITLALQKDGNQIVLEELISITTYCTCVCNFPTTAVLGPFTPGTYTFEVIQIENDEYIQSIGAVSVDIE